MRSAGVARRRGGGRRELFRRRRKGKRGRGAGGKVPVFGLLKRGGKVHTVIIPNAGSKTLLPIIRERINPMRGLYRQFPRPMIVLDVSEFRHMRINHRERFADKRTTTSTASRTSGTRPSAICAATTAFLERSFTSTSRSASGASITDPQTACWQPCRLGSTTLY